MRRKAVAHTKSHPAVGEPLSSSGGARAATAAARTTNNNNKQQQQTTTTTTTTAALGETLVRHPLELSFNPS